MAEVFHWGPRPVNKNRRRFETCHKIKLSPLQTLYVCKFLVRFWAVCLRLLASREGPSRETQLMCIFLYFCANCLSYCFQFYSDSVFFLLSFSSNMPSDPSTFSARVIASREKEIEYASAHVCTELVCLKKIGCQVIALFCEC